MNVLRDIFAPGLFSSAPVHTAALLGAVVALVCAPAGLFIVMRGQSFAGHAFSDMTATGGSAAALAGVNPLAGLVSVSLVGAAFMGASGAERQRGRDLATGTTLGAALGLSALFLYLTTTTTSATGATVTVLFGSVFAVSSSDWPIVVGLGGCTVVLVLILWRPLLLSSLSSELAAARGVRLRLVDTAHLASVAIAVSLAALCVGAILSTALLVGPAAAGLRLGTSPGRACAWAAGIGILSLWAGIVLAYDSYYWPPAHQGWPVSFFVVVLVVLCYSLARLGGRSSPQPKVGS
jgi:zinc/manganese transport system permease protein